MLRVELGKAFRRWRTRTLAGMAAAVPVLLVVTLLLAGPPAASEGAPPFLALVLHNGYFAALASLAAIQPFFLPLATGLLAGDSIAGEASAGTLRYLLVRPVRRTALIGAKYTSIMVQLCAGVAWVMAVAVTAGAIAYGLGPLPSLSGSTLGSGAVLVRLGGAGLYVAAGMAALAAVGMFVSTLTDSGPGATAATVALWIVSQIASLLPGLRSVHPYLLGYGGLAFGDLFRSPVAWDAMLHGLAVDAAYVVVFLAAAVYFFGRKDITS